MHQNVSARSKSAVGTLLLLSCMAAALLSACRDDATQPRIFEDKTPPRLAIILPTPDRYDITGDGLMDLHFEFSDSGSGIDLGSLRVRSLRGANGSADAQTNLKSKWNVERSDSTILILHETLEDLLHDGDNQIEISVADRAGNRAVDTVTVTLPPGQLMTTLLSGFGGLFITDAKLCDDGLIYMTPANAIMIVDPQNVRIVSVQAHPTYIGLQRDLACFSGNPIIYTMPDGFQFDRVQRQWTLGSIRPGGWHSVVRSRRESGLMYVGVDGPGRLAEVMAGDTSQRRVIPVPRSSEEREQVSALAVLPGDEKIYMSRILEGGVLAIDPVTGAILRRIHISGPNWTYPGRSDAFELSHDNQTLYIAVLDGDPRGVAAVNTRTDEITALLPLEESRPLDLALSPSGKRIFVTTAERYPWLPADNVLVDVKEWRVIKEFARAHPEGELRWDNGIVFRPDGKLIFVGHNLDVDVYLNRE